MIFSIYMKEAWEPFGSMSGKKNLVLYRLDKEHKEALNKNGEDENRWVVGVEVETHIVGIPLEEYFYA